MNAQKQAIRQAQSYWREHGLALEDAAIEAHQAPLPGSVWCVIARRALGTCYGVLVHRQGKGAYRFEPHSPHGYTLYACYKGCERPVAVVAYDAQAREMIARLRQLPLYAGVTLWYGANPSAAWAEATKALLSEKLQEKKERRRQKAAEDERIDRLLNRRVLEALQTKPAKKVVATPAGYPQEIFAQLEAAIKLKNPCYSVHHRKSTQTFLAGRMQQGVCQPFGWVWTNSECPLLIPEDVRSQHWLFLSRRWKRKKYFFYFDGTALRECASDKELKQCLGFDY